METLKYKFIKTKDLDIHKRNNLFRYFTTKLKGNVENKKYGNFRFNNI